MIDSRKDSYPVESDGSVHLTLEGVSLHFEKIEEGVNYLEKSITSLLEKSISVFSELTDPPPAVQNLIKILKDLYSEFRKEADFDSKIKINKDDFFEILKEIEIVKKHYQKKGNSFRAIDEVVKLRNQLFFLFVQGERLIRIDEENKKIIRRVRDNLRLCEDQLATYISKSIQAEESGLLIDFEIDRKIIYCLDYLKKAHRINPYKDNLEKVEEILSFLNGPETKTDPHKIHEMLKEARLILSDKDKLSFAP